MLGANGGRWLRCHGRRYCLIARTKLRAQGAPRGAMRGALRRGTQERDWGWADALSGGSGPLDGALIWCLA